MKMKKLIALGLVAISAIPLISGCFVAEKPGGEETVTLKWLLSGCGKQADSDKVWKVFNEKLSEKLPGTKVEFEIVPINNYKNRWNLLMAAGEPIDIAWEGWVLDYVENINNGYFTELDTLLEENAPKLKSSMPEWVWDGTKYNGRTYAVPNYQMMVSRPIALRTPKALADKYLDIEKVEKIFEKSLNDQEPGLSDECFEALADYMQKLKDNGELGLGITPEIFSWLVGIHYGKIQNTSYYKIADGKIVVKDMYEDDTFDKIYKWMRIFYERGFIRKDVLTVQDFKKDIGTEGGYVLWVHNYDDYTAAQEELYYGFPIELIRLNYRNYISGTLNATNTVIPTTSKNPQRAMKLLELINTEEGKELYNILVYGLEGEHYEKISENRIRTFDYNGTPTIESRYGITPYYVGNVFNAYESQVDVPGYGEYIKNVLHENFEKALYYGFEVDIKEIQGEIAITERITKEYIGLQYGLYDNYKAVLSDMRGKMREAGSTKIAETIQRQIDEQINNKTQN